MGILFASSCSCSTFLLACSNKFILVSHRLLCLKYACAAGVIRLMTHSFDESIIAELLRGKYQMESRKYQIFALYKKIAPPQNMYNTDQLFPKTTCKSPIAITHFAMGCKPYVPRPSRHAVRTGARGRLQTRRR